MKRSATYLAVVAVAGFGLSLPVFADNDAKKAPVPGGDPSSSKFGPGKGAASEGRGAGGPGGAKGGAKGGARGGQQRPGGAEALKETDTDGDGKISKEEFIAASAKRAERMFDHFDADDSGDLDLKELAAMRQRAQGGRPGGPQRPGQGGSGEGERKRPQRPGGGE